MSASGVWGDNTVRSAGREERRAGARFVLCAAAVALATASAAQPPEPGERVTFAQAIERALARNPSSAIAAAGILRADALLAQARSSARYQLTANATSTTLNRGVEFEGVTVTPRTSVAGGLDFRMPIYAPVVWARRVEAQDNLDLANLSAAETRRQTALATADAYLAIIARRRIVEANVRAAQTAVAHVDLATELEARGTGSRLNRLRAEQELATDEGLIESARFLLYRAQEALGVLLAAEGPVDAADEPTFDLPPDAAPHRVRRRALPRAGCRAAAGRISVCSPPRSRRRSACCGTTARPTFRCSKGFFSRNPPTRRSSSCRRTAGASCCR